MTAAMAGWNGNGAASGKRVENLFGPAFFRPKVWEFSARGNAPTP